MLLLGRAEQGLSGAAKEGVLLLPRILQLLLGGYRSSHRARETPWGRGSFPLLLGSENTRPSQDSTHQRSAALPPAHPPIPSATFLTRKEKQDSVDRLVDELERSCLLHPSQSAGHV